jgi:hypothetical protein
MGQVNGGLSAEVVMDDITVVGNSQFGGCGYNAEITCLGSGGIRRGVDDYYTVRNPPQLSVFSR